jgi:hypothetical protein
MMQSCPRQHKGAGDAAYSVLPFPIDAAAPRAYVTNTHTDIITLLSNLR